jgi:hypothetical protein
MKTTNLFRFSLILIAALTFAVTGCKKNDTPVTNGGDKTESMSQLTQDDNKVQDVSDQASDDANTVLSGGKLKEIADICHADIWMDTLIPDTLTVHIHYHGYNCPNTRYRTGDVVIKEKRNENWGMAGATVIVSTINFQVTKPNGKVLTMNGRKTYENVNGGYLYQLGGLATTIVYREMGYMTVTFENGTSKEWNIARQRTFTGLANMDQLVMTVDGLGSADGYSNLVTWGTNRDGEQFYSQINTSVVHKQVCGGDPCSGVMEYQIPSASKSATITFGYDSNNNLITNGDCPTRYRVDWVVGSVSGTFFLQLP